MLADTVLKSQDRDLSNDALADSAGGYLVACIERESFHTACQRTISYGESLQGSSEAALIAAGVSRQARVRASPYTTRSGKYDNHSIFLKAPHACNSTGSRYIYRLWLYDTGGDGWQGATYTMRNSSALAKFSEPSSVVVASGTLGEGFEQADWICLVDGCYELAVGGGSADSELGFRFVDEVGGHFQDLAAPYSDHLCVSTGDVFDHPTFSPTVSPFPTPAPTPTPTSLPSPLPSTLPTASPTPLPTTLPYPFPSRHPTALPRYNACTRYGSVSTLPPIRALQNFRQRLCQSCPPFVGVNEHAP